ncbi:WSC domain-containing protein, partial [Xylogone sp. PMI_703]
MKSLIHYAAGAALISFTTASPAGNQAARELHRRWDAPPLPPCPIDDYTPYSYVGCFVEPSPDTLQYNPNLLYSTMTVEDCTAICKSNGFRYAGLLYYGVCHCGTVQPPTPAPETECNAPCNGNQNETCGANRRISLYEDTTYPTVDLSTIDIVSQYTAKGCYSEGVGYRAVTYRQNQLASSTLTTEQCLLACGNQYYPLAATEYHGECYCGYMLQGGSAPADSSHCNTACNGDSSEICGGSSYLSLYEATIFESTQPCGVLPPPPPPPPSSTTSTTSTTST